MTIIGLLLFPTLIIFLAWRLPDLRRGFIDMTRFILGCPRKEQRRVNYRGLYDLGEFLAFGLTVGAGVAALITSVGCLVTLCK